MRTRSDPGVDATTIYYRDAAIPEDRWATSELNPFQGEDRASKPWELQWAYYLRNNPLRAPGDWQNPQHAALDAPIYELARSWGLDNATVQLAFDRCQLYGTGAYDVSALHLLHIINVATHARQSFGPEQYAISAGNQRPPRPWREPWRPSSASARSCWAFGTRVTGSRSGRCAVTAIAPLTWSSLHRPPHCATCSSTRCCPRRMPAVSANSAIRSASRCTSSRRAASGRRTGSPSRYS